MSGGLSRTRCTFETSAPPRVSRQVRLLVCHAHERQVRPLVCRLNAVCILNTTCIGDRSERESTWYLVHALVIGHRERVLGTWLLIASTFEKVCPPWRGRYPRSQRVGMEEAWRGPRCAAMTCPPLSSSAPPSAAPVMYIYICVYYNITYTYNTHTQTLSLSHKAYT